MNLDLSSLEKALKSLKKAIDRSRKDPADEEIRDAVIQRFEYTYELCWKMLRRHLEQTADSPPQIDHLSFRDLIRTGAEKGMIAHPENWFVYREQRNVTAHTYNREKAESVYKTALEFYPDANALFQELTRRHAC
jgi:nucleotidyltransferase substrate binding protein (TIGR01987 family)